MHLRSVNNKQSGFVLVLALGAILVLTFIVSAVALNVQSLVTIAADVKTHEIRVWESTSARSRVIYSMLTGHKTFHGFSNLSSTLRLDELGSLLQTPMATDLRVDGRWYTMNGFPFSVQDKAGLLSVNSLTEHEFEQLFVGQLSLRQSAEQLSYQFRDFVDTDDNRSLMGAESYDYERVNKPSPLNRSIFLPRELKQLLSWPPAYFPWEVAHTEQLVWNINTAPKSVLSIKTSSNESDISHFLLERENSYFTDISTAERLLGIDTIKQDDLSITSVVSNRFRLAIIPQQVCSTKDNEEPCSFSTRQLLEMGEIKVDLMDFTITPSSEVSPYQVDRVNSTSLFTLELAKELSFPINSEVADTILSTYVEKGVSIGEHSDAYSATENELSINDIIKVKDVPITEYENKAIPLR